MNCGANSAVIADGRVNAVPLPAGVTRHARGCLGRSVRPLLMPATRPSEEYRTPTDEEWDSFLAHFEKRKVSVGTCARAFGSPCIHEHACVRCSLLRPDPAQRGRLEEIRDNLEARIIEAKREGWLGEVEGLQVSYTGVKDKLTQVDATIRRKSATTELGIPPFGSNSGRSAGP